jgi:hypothetical protein
LTTSRAYQCYRGGENPGSMIIQILVVGHYCQFEVLLFSSTLSNFWNSFSYPELFSFLTNTMYHNRVNSTSYIRLNQLACGSEGSSSSVKPNSSMLFLHECSTTSLIGTPFNLGKVSNDHDYKPSTTHFERTCATAPIAHGSFLPLTALPSCHFSGTLASGKYNDLKRRGNDSSILFDACPPVIEHHGASVQILASG